MPQMIQPPFIILPIEIPHVVLKRSLQLAVGLRMPDSRMNETNAQISTKCLDENAFERGAIIREHGIRDHLPLPHGGHERTDYGALVMVERKITKNISSSVVILQRQLVDLLLRIGERDLVHEVSLPEAVGTMAFIEPPQGRRRWGQSRMQGITHLTLEARDRGCADLKLFAIL